MWIPIVDLGEWQNYEAISDLPEVTDLPAIVPPNLHDLPEVDLNAAPVGIAADPIGSSIDAYASPYGDEPKCQIPNGEEVRAVASAGQRSLFILAVTDACEDPVWIWKILVDWKDRDWTDLDLPVLAPKLAEKPTLPIIQPTPTVVVVQAPIPKGDSPLAVFIRDANTGQVHSWHSELPPDWRAASIEEASLVASIREVPELVETCQYIPYSVILRIRSNYEVSLSLRDPSAVVATQIFKGDDPPFCPSVRGQGVPTWQSGNPPQVTEFKQWLESFVLGSGSQ